MEFQERVQWYEAQYGAENVKTIRDVIDKFRDANNGVIPAIYKVYIATPRGRAPFYAGGTLTGDTHSVEISQENREIGLLYNVTTYGWPLMMSVWGNVPEHIKNDLPNTEIGNSEYWDARTVLLRSRKK